MPYPRAVPRTRLPSAVLLLGATSLFTDVASEMIVPLLPLVLAEMRAGAPMLGLIEGVADATASLLKLGSGWLADRTARDKPLVVSGYAIASAVRPLIALASSPWHVLAVRVADRIGKGIRSAPRDAMIAAAVPPGERGRAFGLHRAMDHAGAVIGPLVATTLLALGCPVREVIWAAALPGAIALGCVLAVRAPRRPAPDPEDAAAAGELPLPPRLRRYLLILALFGLGNSSDTFLLLRARDLGVTVEAIPLLWAVLHVSKVVSARIGGDAADRVPRARLIAIGWGVYAASYLALAAASAAWHVWATFVVYGAYHGLTEPAEKALVGDLAPARARGRAFGLYHFVVGATAIAAGLLTGLLWEAASALAALGTGAALAGASAVLLLAWERAADGPERARAGCEQ